MNRATVTDPTIDLSACINPHGWPVPPLPAEVWRTPPAAGDGLELVAARYYGNASLLPVLGRQAAIAMLPQLFPPAMVACIGPLENEHPQAWQQAGHRPRLLQNATLARAVGAATPFVLLANPNPLNGVRQSRETLLAAATQLDKRGGWLIVDESLADPLPEFSVASLAGTPAAPKLIVLRSLAEFFGLAGAPVAFIIAHPDLLARGGHLRDSWRIPNPLRTVARMALTDAAWQAEARRQLGAAGTRLQTLLAPFGDVSGSPLATTLSSPQGQSLHAHLARQGIVAGRHEQSGALRFALPGSESDWLRLAAAIADWKAP